jgi:hypothetical protein
VKKLIYGALGLLLILEARFQPKAAADEAALKAMEENGALRI